jgi:tetratricopeptide (TPR) repeat protein
MATRFNQRQVFFLISLALVAVTFVAYEPIRHNGFVNYDDTSYITENPHINQGITQQSVIWAFTEVYSANWHPLTWLSHALDRQVFGLNPVGHHFVSVVLHIVNVLLLFWILTNITGAIWPSAFVAAVFAMHPLQVESVAWAAERKTVLSGLFWLLTIAAYVRYTRRPGFLRYLLVLLVFGLCIMTKPIVVTLPFVLLLLDYWPLRRLQWGQEVRNIPKKPGQSKVSSGWLIIEKIPLLALSAILSVITVLAQRQWGAVLSLDKLPLENRVANMFLSYVSYIGKMVWPSRLAACYPYAHVTASDFPVVLCAVLFILLSIFSIYICRRKKYAAVGWLWFVGTLVPAIGLVQSGIQAMANRYMYIPMIGLMIIVSWTVKDIIHNRPRMRIVAAVMGAAALSSLLILTQMQVRHWQNSMTLYEYALKVTQNNALAENNYGSALLEAGRLDEAILHLKKALSIVPKMPETENNLGKVYLNQKKFNEAIACFNEAIQKNDNSAETYYNLATALIMERKYSDAIKHLTKVLKLDPHYPYARNRMGTALLGSGRIEEAILCFNELLKQNDNSAEVHYNLGLALSAQKKYDDAIIHFARALEMDPKYPNIHDRMGAALLATGKPDEAVEHLKEGLATSPDQGETYINLATAYTKQSKYGPAIENWTWAAELKPNNVVVLNNLAWLLATAEDASVEDANKAIGLAQRACELTGHKDPDSLDTLAAAYAAAGRFDDAVTTARQAADFARAGGRENLSDEIQQRMKLYQAGRRYRQK